MIESIKPELHCMACGEQYIIGAPMMTVDLSWIHRHGHIDCVESMTDALHRIADFQKVASKIASKEGISEQAAARILASSSRHASASAKKANPRLKRVKG